MSIEEKREEIIEEYHCQDVHGELCADCAKCRECLKGDLLKLENLVRTEVIDEFKNLIRNNKHYFVGDMAELLIYEFEQMHKEQK